VCLFRRTPRGVELLAAGERLLPHAERVLESVLHARSAVHEPAEEAAPGRAALLVHETSYDDAGRG
jgi:DNA-binding transcriptional LysR family regulator